MMKRKKTIYLRASYTVEASLLLPLFLFSILKGLLLGIECYEAVRAASQSMEFLENIAPVEQIWNMQLAQKGVTYIYEYTVPEKSEK